MTDDDIKQLQWDLARARAMHAQAARDRDHYRQALPVGHWKTVSATYAATHYGFPPAPDTGDLHTARDGSVWMFNVDVTGVDVTGAWSLSEPGVEDVSALVVELAETEWERQKAVALERDTAERAQRERVASDRLVDTMDEDFRALRDAVLASGAVVVRGAGGVVTGVVLPSDPDLVACREQLRQESERADREAAEASSLRDEVDRLTRQRDGWRHLFEAQWQSQKELCDKVDELCAQHDQDAAELSSLRDECDRVARERDEKARAYRLEAEQATATARERRIEKAAQMIHGFDDSLSAARALDAAGLLKDGDDE